MKLTADETSNTASFLAFVTEFLILLQFLISTTTILWDYSIIGSFLGLLGFYIGVKKILQYIIDNNKRSYIVLSLCVVLIISALLIFYSGFQKVVHDLKTGASVFKLGRIC